MRVDYPPLENDEPQGDGYEIAPEGKIKVFEENLGYLFRLRGSISARYRANFFQQNRHLRVFRLIRPSLDGRRPESASGSQKISHAKERVWLVTGQTGSGKSTTLAA